MPAESFRCADAAQERGEPLYATASYVRRWLLLEQPGSWGRNAITQSRLPRRVALELRRRTRAAGIRIIVIRRGARLSSEQRSCYFVRTDERELYQARLALDGADQLLDVDLMSFSEGGRVQGAVEGLDPLFLVCTHGRHDKCCAIRGNQVSRIACSHPHLDAWECSHIGGDRFAANLVCFPHGVYYGRVRLDDVVQLMNCYAQGTLSLEQYRGRSCYRFPVQAAEYFVRRESGVTGTDDLWLQGVSRTPEGLTARFFLVDGRRARVEVRLGQAGPYRLTCGSRGAERIPRYDLASCTVR